MGIFSELSIAFGEDDDEGFDLDNNGDVEPPAEAEHVTAEPVTATGTATQAESADSTADADTKIADDDEKRRAHEESEAKRKAEWEKKQASKKAAYDVAMQVYENLSDDDLASEATKRVGKDTERLTRRNMKDCVTEYVQTMFFEDPVLARKAMHPRKNMINCFKYITRLALEYIKQEFEDNGEPNLGFGMGSDVPDDLCYQWAVDYFNDPDAEEDKEKDEEFVPKTYYGGISTTKKAKKEPKKKVEKPKPAAIADVGQMMLGM